MWWIVVATERRDKQGLVARALHAGMPQGSAMVCMNDPPNPNDPFIATGQLWVVERIVPPAVASNKPFWLVDNGYYLAAGKGREKVGHFELTYKGLEPVLLRDPDMKRLPAASHLAPWRKKRGDYVLIALPGPTFGKMLGMNMYDWMDKIEARVRQYTDRPIVVRPKNCPRPLAMDLAGAHVLVTHSSNVAVDAIVAGIPAIVAPSNPAAPVCSVSLKDLEDPPMPDRTRWWQSLMCQQFTLDEMASGKAWCFMKQVMKQVDGS